MLQNFFTRIEQDSLGVFIAVCHSGSLRLPNLFNKLPLVKTMHKYNDCQWKLKSLLAVVPGSVYVVIVERVN